MNISAALYNNMGVGSYKQPAAETVQTQGDTYSNSDSVTISKAGLAELKSLLRAAENAKSTNDNSNTACVNGIERRAGSIVTSKAVARYSARA